MEEGVAALASLTHVCIWAEHGWTHITAEEAAQRFPSGTISANSGLFMCDLCNQYVTLTDGEQRGRYFRHSAYEISKNCPERTFGSGYTPKIEPGAHTLPIRLTKCDDFSLEIGMLLIPAEILERQTQRTFSVHPQGSVGESWRYSFERLLENGVTYVSIGDEPAESYRIDCAPELRPYWPAAVAGISATCGRLFDSANRKMLPEDADVQIGKQYYYLSATRMYRRVPGLSYRLIAEKSIRYRTWRLYELKPTMMTQDAARFFLERRYRLTDRPVCMTALWPLFAASSYVMKYGGGELFFQIQGGDGITSSVFPVSKMDTSSGNDGSTIVRVTPAGRWQMISACRAGRTLDFLYFWRESLQNAAKPTEVEIMDWKGKPVFPDGTALPEKGILQFQLPFDGSLEVWSRGVIAEKMNLLAGRTVQLTQIGWGKTILIRQGLDIIWKQPYEKTRVTSDSASDEMFLAELKRCWGKAVPFGAEAGVIAGKLHDYPKTKAWLRYVACAGSIPEEAYRKICEIISQR